MPKNKKRYPTGVSRPAEKKPEIKTYVTTTSGGIKKYYHYLNGVRCNIFGKPL